MEVLHMFGTPEQKSQWLEPLLEGQIRSAFAMTEPDVASSDATNISTRIVRDGDDYVINGRKWWTSGINDPRCKIMILMGKTDTSESVHRQQSMILVPTDTPGVEIVRALPVFGYQDQHGHGEVRFTDVRVPGDEPHRQRGRRLHDRPGAARARPHPPLHAGDRRCRARAQAHVRAGRLRDRLRREIAKQGVVREQIAESRMEIDQARLMVLKTADMIDKVGAKGARSEIAAIKVIAPRVALNVVDRAIQVHGGRRCERGLPARPDVRRPAHAAHR
jgi:acyl-CoA dehydrogenase